MSQISRRNLLLLGACAALGPAAAAELQISEDGLHVQPWFIESFLDLPEDFENARTAGRTLVLLWELRNCPLCKILHLTTFSDTSVTAYIKAHFDFLQLNFIGARPVTDFDGQRYAEKDLASKYRIPGTPALQFFKNVDSAPREIHRASYMEPQAFLGLLKSLRANR